MRSSRARVAPRSAPGAVRGGIARETRTVLFGGARRRRRTLWAMVVVGVLALAGAAVAVAAGTASARTTPRDAGTAQAAQLPTLTPTPVPATPVPTADPEADPTEAMPPEPPPLIEWRSSVSRGRPWAGRLVRGVQLPAEGPDWFTLDGVDDRVPNPGWRRWGNDALVLVLIEVLAEFRAAHPDASRVGIGDLSRRRGGHFGPEFGGLGHASHQNGLDADVWWPREDGLERRARKPSQVDRELAQDLVDRFRAAGAEKLFVGPSLGLRGPRSVVVPLVHHDDHLHLRIRRP